MSFIAQFSSRRFLIASLITLSSCSCLVYLYISTEYLRISLNEDIIDANISRPVRPNPRVLCLVTTQPNNHLTSAQAVKKTWGQRCDTLYFVSSKPDPSLPAIRVKCEADDHNHLWCKNRKGIMYGVDRWADQFDWFLKTDDDTYVIMENLKNLLSQYDPNEAIWFGCQFALGGNRDITYMSGGAGYAISRKAMVELNQEFKNQSKCKEVNMGETGADDVEIGRCLNKLGVKLGDSRDQLKRNRFFPFMAGDFVNPDYNVSAGVNWFGNYNVFPNQLGFNCCSDTTISFHYLKPVDIYVYEFLIYHLNVHKIKSI